MFENNETVIKPRWITEAGLLRLHGVLELANHQKLTTRISSDYWDGKGIETESTPQALFATMITKTRIIPHLA